jgi:TonB family protein
MRIPWTPLTFACAAALLASPADAAVKQACPGALLLESTNGKYYVVAFGATANVTSSFDLTLYSKSAVYSLPVPSIAIAKPVTVQGAAFRSAPIIVRNPDEGPLLGATVQSTLIVATGRCPAESFVIPSVESLTALDRHVDAQTAAIEDQVASEVGIAAKTPLDPTPVPGAAPLTCDVPFADPSVGQADTPSFPPAAAQAGAYGSISVRVDLDETGKVTGATALGSTGNAELDAAAVASARKATYHPARFACEAQRSSYTVNFDFSK